MKNKQSKKAEKILFSWRKTMPFYYGAIWIVLLIIISVFN